MSEREREREGEKERGLVCMGLEGEELGTLYNVRITHIIFRRYCVHVIFGRW